MSRVNVSTVTRSGAKWRKVFAVLLFAAITHIVFVYQVTAYRIVDDERDYLPDVVEILNQGSVSVLNYPHGSLPQIYTAMIIQVTGGNIHTYQWSAPTVGISILFASTILISSSFGKGRGRWVGAAGCLCAMYIFASYINRLMSLLHPKYTLLMFFLLVWCFARLSFGGAKRIAFLTVLGGFVISTSNTLWPKIYVIVIAIMFVLANPIGIRTLVLAVVSIEVFSATLTTFFPLYKPYMPLIHIVLKFTSSILGPQGTGPQNPASPGPQNPASPSGTRPGVAIEATSAIAQWPTLSLAGIEISWAYVFTVGIPLVVILGVMGAAISVGHFFNSAGPSEFLSAPKYYLDRLFVGAGAGFVLLYLTAFGFNDVDTLRRISVLPATVIVIYVLRRLSVGKMARLPGSLHKEHVVVIIFTFLLIGGLLATPRTIRDGQFNPYDESADFESVRALQFYVTNTPGSADSYGVHSSDQNFHRLLVLFPSISEIPSFSNVKTADKVYTSGGNYIFRRPPVVS